MVESEVHVRDDICTLEFIPQKSLLGDHLPSTGIVPVTSLDCLDQLFFLLVELPLFDSFDPL